MKAGKNSGIFEWEYHITELFDSYINEMEIPPTKIVMNWGAWNSDKVLTSTIEKWMTAAAKTVNRKGEVSVYWTRTTPHVKEIREKSRWFKPSDQAASKYCGDNPSICKYIDFPDSLFASYKNSDYLDSMHFKVAKGYEKWSEEIYRNMASSNQQESLDYSS